MGRGGYKTTPETYGLSQELGDDLAAWQAFFEEHANPFEGWDTDANLKKWLSDGESLALRSTGRGLNRSLTCYA